MPLFSRIGPYDPALLVRAAERRPRRLVEYWAHVQALMPVELWPLMRHRMDFYRERRGKWWRDVDPAFTAWVSSEVAARGRPVTASELDDGTPRSTEHWGWNWSQARQALDYLFMVGDLAMAGRTSQFEPRYDLPERVLPPDVLALPTPSPQEAVTALVRRAARSHGVATATCLADYYRLRQQPASDAPSAQRAVDELVAAGELERVQVEGWRKPAYLHRDARLPRRVRARALLSPFDPVVWQRERTERLFGFRYRIEIYVPAPQRQFGYYVLPFLLGDRPVGRVDLKADRAAGVLRVQSAWREPDAPPETAAELATELERLGRWLGQERVVVGPRGDLAPALADEVSRIG
ncbi:winged helix-turn-helix domain-containing protein [Nocardioides acrostichi]|uniref:winged helix-turn-helix domain-containing protein n=1 Tax=Nocardioides acrostichi TaxID=2784339 RepID=UPI002E2D3A1D|nr:crosslink repair DNA glycosylase YcaQ family protein [Nocardioides acrostichi]